MTDTRKLTAEFNNGLGYRPGGVEKYRGLFAEANKGASPTAGDEYNAGRTLDASDVAVAREADRVREEARATAPDAVATPQYDAHGRPIDEKGHVIGWTDYDKRGRPIGSQLIDENAQRAALSYYDLEGRRTA